MKTNPTMTTPTLNVTSAAFQDAEREDAYWRTHRRELAQQYPDQFVAIHDESVVAAASDLQKLVIALRASGLKPTDVWLRFLAVTPRTLLL